MTDTEIVERFLEGWSLGALAACANPGSVYDYHTDMLSHVAHVIRRRLQGLTDELRVVYEGTVDMRGKV